MILATAVAKFLDPMIFIAALIGAYPVRKWWQVVLLGVLLGCLYQLLLLAMGAPNQTSFAFGVIPASIAATAHAWIAYGLHWWFRNKARLPETQPWRALTLGVLGAAACLTVIAPGAVLATMRDAGSSFW